MQYHLKKLTLLLPECVPQPANPLAPPISVVLAGAGVCNGPSAPRRTCSPEKSEPPSPQLRPTFSRRRTADYRKPNSGEKPALRRKAPAPTKVVFAGAGANVKHSPPPSHRSTEDSLRSRTQLRPTFARRSRADYRKPTSCEKGVHRRNSTQTCSLTKSEPNNRLILLFYAAQLVIMTSNKRVSIRF